MYKQAAESR